MQCKITKLLRNNDILDAEYVPKSQLEYTVQCSYNAVYFLKTSQKIDPRPLGRDMGCILCAPTLIYI